MRSLLIIATLALLSACGGTTPAPVVNAAQVQADLATAAQVLKSLGCIVQSADQAAAPIIQITTDASGQKIAQTIDAVSGKVCSAPVPAGQ